MACRPAGTVKSTAGQCHNLSPLAQPTDQAEMLETRAVSEPAAGDLSKAKTVTDDELNAAVDVFMRDPTVSMFRFASGHTLDLAAVVKAHEPARAAVAHSDRSEKFRRGMVRTAIQLRLQAGVILDAKGSVSRQALKALRAVALLPCGIQLSVYPQMMQALIVLGYVVQRQARWEGACPGEMGRFITPAGYKLLASLGNGIRQQSHLTASALVAQSRR